MCQKGRRADLPNDILALVAHRSPGARRHVLSLLHDGVEVLWMRLRGGAVVTFRSSAGNFAKRGNLSALWKTFSSRKHNGSVSRWSSRSGKSCGNITKWTQVSGKIHFPET